MKAWLSRTNADIETRDFFDDPFTEQELRALLGDSPPSQRFSWNSPSWRRLGLNRSDLSEDDLIQLMLSEPRLIRRPLIEIDGELLPPMSGAKKIREALEAALGQTRAADHS